MVPVIRFNVPVIRFKLPEIRFKLPVIRFNLPVIRFKVPVIRFKVPVIRHKEISNNQSINQSSDCLLILSFVIEKYLLCLYEYDSFSLNTIHASRKLKEFKLFPLSVDTQIPPPSPTLRAGFPAFILISFLLFSRFVRYYGWS